MLGLQVFNQKPNEDNLQLCDPDLLIQDTENNVMPIFKSDEIYSRNFEVNFEDISDEGQMLMPTTFDKFYVKNKVQKEIKGPFQIAVYCDHTFDLKDLK